MSTSGLRRKKMPLRDKHDDDDDDDDDEDDDVDDDDDDDDDDEDCTAAEVVPDEEDPLFTHGNTDMLACKPVEVVDVEVLGKR